jgi:D-alanyl-D-alanine endopeptidase (penicillin-binding protein 7)
MYKLLGSVLIALISSISSAATISAKSIVIEDIATGQVIYAKNDNKQRSIASITKLVTAMTVIESGQDLQEQLPIRRSKYFSTYIPNNVKTLTREKLIELALVSSDNTAAYNLCYYYITGIDSCVFNMNKLAEDIGARQTKFVDPTGLLNQNVSTADDLVLILKHSLTYDFIKKNGALATTSIEVPDKRSSSAITYANTNRLLQYRHDILVTKTGWISASGGCIAMIVTKYGKNFAVVLLGSQNTHTRLSEAKALIDTYILPVM